MENGQDLDPEKFVHVGTNVVVKSNKATASSRRKYLSVIEGEIDSQSENVKMIMAGLHAKS